MPKVKLSRLNAHEGEIVLIEVPEMALESPFDYLHKEEDLKLVDSLQDLRASSYQDWSESSAWEEISGFAYD